MYYFHPYTPRALHIACIQNLKKRVDHCLLTRTKGRGRSAKAAFQTASWESFHLTEGISAR